MRDGRLFRHVGPRRHARDPGYRSFTADDLIGADELPIGPGPTAAAITLLRNGADKVATILADVGPDRDLVDEIDLLDDDWPGWRLCANCGDRWRRPDHRVQTVRRKRPSLRPIWVSVVATVTDTVTAQWEPLRVALRKDDQALHCRLLHLRDAGWLPGTVSPLRVLDVIAWREGRYDGL